MFNLRLGLALGKSLSEVRSMPADEVDLWKTFYRLEPWGWHDREYRTAAILAQVWNVHVNERHLVRRERDYYRDIYGLYTKAISERETDSTMRQKLIDANLEERKQMIAQAFGTMVKEVNIGGVSSPQPLQ